MINKKILSTIIDMDTHPLNSSIYRFECRDKLDNDGVLVLENFLLKDSIKSILNEANKHEDLAYYCVNKHNVYLKPSDPSFHDNHPRNKNVISSKGCITDDQIPDDSSLRVLYNSKIFKEFLCEVLNEETLYKYDDELSSINIHYAKEGQELGWHFDNSSFAITLLIQKPISGGYFEYIRDFRSSSVNESHYEQVSNLLDNKCSPQRLKMENGSLVLFRGKNAIHRVTPTEGGLTRVLSVLAYNSRPDVKLSKSARMTFFGKLN